MKIRYISWADNTGYAIAAKSYLFAFYRAGQNISWTPMLPDKHGYSPSGELHLGDSVLSSLLANGGDYDLMVIHTVPEYYAPWVAEARSKGKRVLGYTVWELERLPDHWPAILNQLDAVVVPCSWNVEVFRRSGVTVPIHVVPHLSQFGDLPGQILRQADCRWLPATATSPDRFMFYSIGHWSNRKAPNLVVQAFLRAFGANDPVSLLIKTSRNDVTRWHRHWRNAFRRRHPSPMLELRRMLKDRAATPPIFVIPDESLEDAQMLALHQRGNCYVSLARTEGWGLGAFDAALSGIPVIMTGYGGQMDFLDPELTHLVDFHMTPVHEPLWHENYRRDDCWAEPDIDHAASLMRGVFENQQAAAENAHLLSKRLRERFTEREIVAAWNRAILA